MHISLAGTSLPVLLRSAHPLTDEATWRFCAANPQLRIERERTGELLVMTPAGNRTGRRNSAIVAALDHWSDQDGRGYAFDSSTGFTLPDGSMRSPDAAWVQAARWDALAPEDQDRFSHLCPDFIVELRSPSDNLADLQEKMEQWMANGAELAWLIDPVEQVATIYRPGDAPEHHYRPNSLQGDGAVGGFELVMARVWE